jgi:hypothetical protein
MGLALLLILSFMFHVGNKIKQPTILNFNVKFLAFLLGLIYFSLQSNFAITSHNFGFQNESNIFLKIYYSCAIVVFLTSFILLSCTNFVLFNNSRLINYKAPMNFKYYVVLTMAIIIIALLPLLTDIL